ncbi:MAG: serine/threonine protein phosphatase [Lachnospiraceae bacterium]|nr:serine/threonine protein phosphatase [Lachnospiraceae bacterium]
MKQFYAKYKHAIPLIMYAFLYMIWFMALEQRNVRNYTVIHMKIDDYIPFCELFAIPYFLWFLYVATTVLYLFFTNKKEYYQLCIFLFTGMTIFLIVSTVFPNGQHLRPASFARDNILTHLVAFLYRTDTATNICPSIHVYNALAAHIAISKSNRLGSHKNIQKGSAVLSFSIILSTVFLKQHSMFDVITACGMAMIVYAFVYLADYSTLRELSYRYKEKHSRDTANL